MPGVPDAARRAKGQPAWEIIPRDQKPYPRCVFCGDRANSREHVIPKWISKQLGIKDFLSAEDAFIAGGASRPKQPISFANYRARVFCRACNTHFKHLEDAVIPLIVPMARGRTVSLDRATQALLALWADKTAIALIAATDELREVVPAGHLRAVRSEGRVADHTWVAFFPWRGGPVIGTGRPVITGTANSTTVHEAYAAFLAFARLGFYVLAVVDGLEPEETIDGDRPPIRQLWPQRTRLLHWPPTMVADNKILPGLMSYVPLRHA